MMVAIDHVSLSCVTMLVALDKYLLNWTKSDALNHVGLLVYQTVYLVVSQSVGPLVQALSQTSGK